MNTSAFDEFSDVIGFCGGVFDTVLDFIVGNKVDEDGEPYNDEYVDTVIMSAVLGLSDPFNRQPEGWTPPSRTQLEACMVVGQRLIRDEMITRAEYSSIVESAQEAWNSNNDNKDMFDIMDSINELKSE